MEGRLEAIEKKLASAVDPLVIPTPQSEMAHLKSFQCKTLVELRQLRKLLVQEGSSTSSSSKAVSSLQEENNALKDQVAALEYRITHLLRHVK